MDIKLHTVHFDADQKLLDFVNDRLEKIEHYNSDITTIDVYLKLENTSHSHINDKVVEIKINIPHNQIFVKETSKTFEDSFTNALDSVLNQIKRK